MFVEELSKIKECEDKAEKIRKDAKAKSEIGRAHV